MRISPAILIIILFSSCASENLFTVPKNAPLSDLKSFNTDSSYQYVIRKDDKISISIWDNSDLSVGSIYDQYNSNEVYGKWLLVDADGKITVPKVGKEKVEGLTLISAEALLRKEFAKWLVNPVIELKVLNKEVSVLGELKNPGKFILDKDDNTLIDAISKAGDFDFYADKKNIVVIRQNGTDIQQVKIDLTSADNLSQKNVHIQPGDVVYVPSRKGKEFDKRSGSTIIPFTAVVTTVVVLLNFLK